MSNVGKSRHSSHRWRNKTRCKVKAGREDYRVTHLTTLAQEQSRNYSRIVYISVWVIEFTNVFVLK